ncbi:hypothetical protein QEN19_002635 [Hanseniaspora menglaensis]
MADSSNSNQSSNSNWRETIAPILEGFVPKTTSQENKKSLKVSLSNVKTNNSSVETGDDKQDIISNEAMSGEKALSCIIKPPTKTEILETISNGRQSSSFAGSLKEVGLGNSEIESLGSIHDSTDLAAMDNLVKLEKTKSIQTPIKPVLISNESQNSLTINSINMNPEDILKNANSLSRKSSFSSQSTSNNYLTSKTPLQSTSRSKPATPLKRTSETDIRSDSGSVSGITESEFSVTPTAAVKENVKKIGKIGVCALDNKVLSKPCRRILNRLMEHGEFETIIFGDKVLFDEDVENWPTCDFLISFFSNGFPLDKAIEYAKLRKPYQINDLTMQKLLWDRRLVLKLLQINDVPSPEKLEISRDGGPHIDDDLKKKFIEKGMPIDFSSKEPDWRMIDDDILEVDGKRLEKPFVEKPVNGEDHNIYIYYHSSNGGGGRRLFRKIGNKASEFDAELNMIRTDGSFIYEKFMDADNCEDVKAYTVSPKFCHAETRKSPVVDGIVKRNTHGKEIRYITALTDEEKIMASKVCSSFEQTICGFDLLRAQGKSFVIDVNGFSFVKDNNEYYDSTAKILKDMFIAAKEKKAADKEKLQNLKNKTKSLKKSKGIIKTIIEDDAERKRLHITKSEANLLKLNQHENQISSTNLKEYLETQNKLEEEKDQRWVFKGMVTIVRHGDRTPKQKHKYSFTSDIFISLLKGHKEEVIIRNVIDLEIALKALVIARDEKLEDLNKLCVLIDALSKKLNFPGTKIQLKPVLNKKTNEVEKVQFILKFFGEATHSAKYQASELGEQMRLDFGLLNKSILEDNNIKIFSSSERRVLYTAQLWAAALYGGAYENDIFIRKDLLDDSNAAKELMDKVKKKLKPLLRIGQEAPSDFTWPTNMPQPYLVMKRVCELMRYNKSIMDYHFEHSTPEELTAYQDKWCCAEDSKLFKERWDKLFAEFTTVEKVDPSKISELYDTMKFDALHNRAFLEKIFYPGDDNVVNEEIMNEDLVSNSLVNRYPINLLAKNNFKVSSTDKPGLAAPLTSPSALIDLTSKSRSVSVGSAASQSSNTTAFGSGYSHAPGSFTSQSVSSNLVPTPTPTSSTNPKGSVGSLGWVLEGKMNDKNSDSVFSGKDFSHLRELFKLSKVLFDFICPQEYGITDDEKLDIGLLTSLPLAKQILNDIDSMKAEQNPQCVAYFTKESHIYTLLNILYESGLPMRIARNALPELDYLSQINFELYERIDKATGEKTHSIRLKLSPGCQTQDPLDVQLDGRHYISCSPKISLTRHLDAAVFEDILRKKFTRVKLPDMFTAVNITSPSLTYKGYKVKDVMTNKFSLLSPSATLEEEEEQ